MKVDNLNLYMSCGAISDSNEWYSIYCVLKNMPDFVNEKIAKLAIGVHLWLEHYHAMPTHHKMGLFSCFSGFDNAIEVKNARYYFDGVTKLTDAQTNHILGLNGIPGFIIKDIDLTVFDQLLEIINTHNLIDISKYTAHVTRTENSNFYDLFIKIKESILNNQKFNLEEFSRQCE